MITEKKESKGYVIAMISLEYMTVREAINHVLDSMDVVNIDIYERMEISLEYNFLSLIGYKYEKDEEYSNKVTPLKLEIVNFTQCNDEQKAILKELETCIKNILAIDTKINRTTTSLTNETDEEYSNRAELEYLKKCNEDRKATIKEVDSCIYNVRAAHSDYIHHINNKHFS